MIVLEYRYLGGSYAYLTTAVSTFGAPEIAVVSFKFGEARLREPPELQRCGDARGGRGGEAEAATVRC
jgi:hypothetical protein